MCSVVGCVGTTSSKKYVLEGLARLEYRGYDSAGFASIDHTHHIQCVKTVGGVNHLIDKLHHTNIDGFVAFGHTRWATHGNQTTENAHPHTDCTQSISIVHNGIVENYQEIKQSFTQKHQFTSQTDTEVVVHLLEEILQQHPDPQKALIKLVSHLEGAYAFIILLAQYPHSLFFVRNRSPLCIGMSAERTFIASDVLAFGAYTNQVVFVPDQSIGMITADNLVMWDNQGNNRPITIKNVESAIQYTHKDGYEHFMLKEIYEQRQAVTNTIDYLESLNERFLPSIGMTLAQIQTLTSFKILGCGASWFASRIAQFFFESIAQIPTGIHLASEFRYMPFFHDPATAYLFVSQSGETADTLEALRMVHDYNIPTIALTNVYASSMMREAQGQLLMQAGPEIAVASTKAFSAQIASLYWLAHKIAYLRNTISKDTMMKAIADIHHAVAVLERTIERHRTDIITHHASFYARFAQAICLGRHISYPFAMEAALKLKEISYIFSQCYPAGELKHGPLALVDEQTPIFVFSVLDPLLYKKLISNVQEAKARNAHIVAFGFTGQDELKNIANLWIEIEPVAPLLAPLAMTGVMQFFVYSIAKTLGLPIDKPRNLAKSVTVE